MDKLYEMKLNERYEPRNMPERLTIIRVPGGWIYRFHQITGHDNWVADSVFVPFDNEFQNK